MLPTLPSTIQLDSRDTRIVRCLPLHHQMLVYLACLVCRECLAAKMGIIYHDTLQGINISHLGKTKIIFKMPFLGDMLVPWRVHFIDLDLAYQKNTPKVMPEKVPETIPKELRCPSAFPWHQDFVGTKATTLGDE